MDKTPKGALLRETASLSTFLRRSVSERFRETIFKNFSENSLIESIISRRLQSAVIEPIALEFHTFAKVTNLINHATFRSYT